MLSQKQRAVVRDAQMKKWKAFGEVKIPTTVVEDYAEELFAVYKGATFTNGSLESTESRRALFALCDEAEIETEDDADLDDALRLLISSWRTRWVKERSAGDEDESRAKKIIRYWLDAIERVDWDAIGKAAVSSNLGGSDFTSLAQGQWIPKKDVTLAEDTAALLIAHIGKNAVFVVPIVARKDGQIGVAEDDDPMLLNPYYFPGSDAEVTEWSIAMSDDIATHLTGSLWKTRWDSILENFRSASIDLQRVTTMSNRENAMNIKWCISDTADVSATVAWIVRAYRQLLNDAKVPRLLERVLGLEDAPRVKRSLPLRPRHVDEFLPATGKRRVLPMDRTQRMAATYAATLAEDEALVVNGPPGTGKTTFLRGVIANNWIQPLVGDVAEPKPPIIVGTGVTNIAVQNILRAFDEAPAPKNDKPSRFDERWIPGMASYGWYFPSGSRKTDRQSLREHDGRLQYLNTSDTLGLIADPDRGPQQKTLIGTLESAYLAAAEEAFHEKFDDVAAVVARLRACLKSVDKEARVGISNLAKAVEKAFALDDDSGNDDVEIGVDTFLYSDIDMFWEHLRDEGAVERYRSEAETAVEARTEGKIEESDLLHALSAYSEVAYAPILFHLAARTWEGLWLLAQRKRDPSVWLDIEDELRTAAMLGPCIVSTFHTLPSIAKDEDGLRFRLFDLLIIDEAGQASAEIAAASIAFAKRLIVVGDLEQLQPIPRVKPAEDRSLLAKAGLADLDDALTLSSGSTLRIAKHLSIGPAARAVQDRGVTLLYHYRCRNEIIEFCNGLRYDGKLHASRPPLTKEPPWPPMSFVYTDGHFGGEQSVAENRDAWTNRQEAVEIAEWLVEEREALEKFYERPLAEIVAVITPFVGQEGVLIAAIREKLGYRNSELDGMIVGTVSKLQGAEKSVVLFSSVVTPEKQSPWVDENEHLINVAVSRAKDSFVCFGAHGILFQPQAETALSKLGAYFKDKSGRLLYPEELLVVEAPGKVDKIAKALGRRRLVLASGGHFRELPDFDQPEPDWSAIRWVEKNSGAIDAIARAARELPTLVLATDDDREGEAIAWHVLDALGLRKVELKRESVLRMRFSNLTADTLRHARERASVGLDLGRVRAAITRTVLDNLIGRRYAKAIGVNDGVGRVQSALLLSAIEYEHERTEPRPRYALATIEDGEGRTVQAWIVEDETSLGDRVEVRGPKGYELNYPEDSVVADLGERSVVRRIPAPKAPGTADVLIAASRYLRLQPASTMQLLQELYLGTKR